MKDELELIKATIDDSEKLHKMQILGFKALLEKYEDYESNPGAETLEKVRWRFSLGNADQYFICLYSEEIGYVRIYRIDEDTCRLSQIFILPAFQGKGYAQKAIKQVESLYFYAINWNLDTIKQEPKLCHLYEKMGYRQSGFENNLKVGMDIVEYAKKIMQFTWIDYPDNYEDELEKWYGESIQFTEINNSIKNHHEWFIKVGGHSLGADYFCKIILDGSILTALCFITIYEDNSKTKLTENIINIEAFITNPVIRNQGYATRAITELMQKAEKIIPSTNNIFIAQIHKDNIASKKLFENLGFHLICTEEEMGNNMFDWIYPVEMTEKFMIFRKQVGW